MTMEPDDAFERTFAKMYAETPARPSHVPSLPAVRATSRRRYVVWGGASTLAAAALLVALRITPWQRSDGKSISFAINVPGAQHVSVVGDFNGWNPEASPMTSAEQGHWRTNMRVNPGRHEYAFVVDGREWVSDSLAPQAPDAGFGRRNSVIYAP